MNEGKLCSSNRSVKQKPKTSNGLNPTLASIFMLFSQGSLRELNFQSFRSPWHCFLIKPNSRKIVFRAKVTFTKKSGAKKKSGQVFLSEKEEMKKKVSKT